MNTVYIYIIPPHPRLHLLLCPSCCLADNPHLMEILSCVVARVHTSTPASASSEIWALEHLQREAA